MVSGTAEGAGLRIVPGAGAGKEAPANATPPASLHIMHVILSRGFAGSERAAAEACNAMCAEHEVSLVVRRDHRHESGASVRDYVDPRVRVFEVPARWFTRRRLAAAIREARPQVIHTHLRRGTRYVAQIAPDAAHFCTLHLSLNGPHFLKADGLVCITEWQFDTVPADYRGRVFLVPNSLIPQPRLPDAEVQRLRASLGVRPSDFLVGGVGRLAESKGFDVLIRAFGEANLPGGRLVIVGEGRERRRLESLAGSGVTFTGYRADAKVLFQAFDVFVSPSRSEPFGRVIIEALDAGVPVIATEALGPRDIARRFPVELVPIDDVTAMAGALRRAAERPRRRLTLDLSEFHVERVATRLVEAYRDVLATQPARS